MNLEHLSSRVFILIWIKWNELIFFFSAICHQAIAGNKREQKIYSQNVTFKMCAIGMHGWNASNLYSRDFIVLQLRPINLARLKWYTSLGVVNETLVTRLYASFCRFSNDKPSVTECQDHGKWVVIKEWLQHALTEDKKKYNSSSNSLIRYQNVNSTLNLLKLELNEIVISDKKGGANNNK